MHPLRILGLWFLIAVGFVTIGGMTWLAAPFPQALLGGLTAALFVCYSRHGGFREWMERLPTASIPFQAWNLIGLIDITFVVSFATKNAIADPQSMAPLLRLPLGLFPTFVVPLIVFTHGVVLVRGVRSHRLNRTS